MAKKKPCENCKHIQTCNCPNCEKAFCTQSNLHINEIAVEEIVAWGCFEYNILNLKKEK
jgi:hypothetical protein